jgi:hypothetical protein
VPVEERECDKVEKKVFNKLKNEINMRKDK